VCARVSVRACVCDTGGWIARSEARKGHLFRGKTTHTRSRPFLSFTFLFVFFNASEHSPLWYAHSTCVTRPGCACHVQFVMPPLPLPSMKETLARHTSTLKHLGMHPPLLLRKTTSSTLFELLFLDPQCSLNCFILIFICCIS
jgi:hypothetical protein